MPRDMTKQSLYLPEEMLKEIDEEAKRLERSRSWVVTRAWKLARGKVGKMASSDPDKQFDDTAHEDLRESGEDNHQ